MSYLTNGAIAQLVEHLHGMQGVRGSNPLGSILKSLFNLFLIKFENLCLVDFFVLLINYVP